MGTDPALAEYLPVLYRVALDALDALARRGDRTEAARLRTKAGRAYSRSWDEHCRRTLELTIVRAHAAAGTPAPPLPLPGFLAPSD
ncbi:MAG TPA: hypothetical protein VLR93_07220 [Patescibacteria group bacterium]|nr:hypothetical protein [Patescibacteria group bacterium]